MVDVSISYASLSALPPETNYIQIVNYIMYFCWVNKTHELELELDHPAAWDISIISSLNGHIMYIYI